MVFVYAAEKWIESYLSDRKQFVKICDSSSNALGVSCGVPQGSVLGPRLFILYINDICNVSKILKFVLFADDTNILYSDANVNNLNNVVNSELDKLNTWFIINKLSLNVSKTNYILFGNRKVHSDLDIKIHNDKITRVSETKFPGVWIYEKLNWKKHVDLTRFNKIATQGAPQMAVDKEANSLSRVYSYYSKFNLCPP